MESYGLPGALNAWPARQSEAVDLHQMRAIFFLHNLPQVNAVVIQERKYPSLLIQNKPHILQVIRHIMQQKAL